MLQDISAIAKYTVLFIGSIYGYLKLSKIKLRWINIIDLMVAALFATGLYFATKQIRFLVPIGLFLLTFLYSLIRYRRSALSTITTATISCGITIIIMVIALFVSLPFIYISYKFANNETIKEVITVCVICVLQLVLTFLIYRIKRFKSGISVQNNDGSIEILLLISILCIFLMSLFYAENIANSSADLIISTIIFCGLALIVWWRKHITSNYLKQIHKRNESIYEHRIEEYEKERGELLAQNAELSKIIHRDNKLIPAMAAAVEKIIADAPNKNDFDDVLSQLEELSAEHKEIINLYQAKSDTLPKTGNTALDAVIHFLNAKCMQCGVSAEFKIDGEAVPPLLQKINDRTDLNTILCDLGENAVIATKSIPNGKICIAIEKDGLSVPSVCFYDNGDKFDKRVIANMGKKRVTTHKAEGGSGIGLLTLFEILNKYNASYCLDERSDYNEYTKMIKISFDDLHNVNFLTERE